MVHTETRQCHSFHCRCFFTRTVSLTLISTTLLLRFQCGSEVWGQSSSCSLHQTLHSAPQWNGSSSLQPSLRNHNHVLASGTDLIFAWSHNHFSFKVTFSHKSRNCEVHNSQGGIVDHVILFHFIKLCFTDYLFLLLAWRSQAKKVAEFV